VSDELRSAIKRQRGYADFFDWPDKSGKEAGIVESFIEALSREDSSVEFIGKTQHTGQDDPPDFHLTTKTGKSWGIEITELVSQRAIEENKRGNEIHAVWLDNDLIDKFRSLVRRKDDLNAVKGGPYDRYVLLIHTDEYFISLDRLRTLLGHLSITTTLISDIYILFSYDPNLGYCPLLHLPICTRCFPPAIGTFTPRTKPSRGTRAS
jgi:hypothetical protein